MGDRAVDAVKEAETLKAAGNHDFTEGRYKAAIDSYCKAVSLFNEHALRGQTIGNWTSCIQMGGNGSMRI